MSLSIKDFEVENDSSSDSEQEEKLQSKAGTSMSAKADPFKNISETLGKKKSRFAIKAL